MSFQSEVFADFEAACRSRAKANWLRVALGALQYAGFRGALLYRIGNRARQRRLRFAYRLIERAIRLLCGLDISTGAEIGEGLFLPHPRAIVIGDRTKIGARAYILQGVTFGGSGKRGADGQSQPRVGDDALIGAGAALVGPITIGNRVKVGANAVVSRDVPDECTVVGNPATIVRLGNRRVSLLEQDSELGNLLRDITTRVTALEDRLRALTHTGSRTAP